MPGQASGEQRAGADEQAQAPGRFGGFSEKGAEMVTAVLTGSQAP